MKMFDFNTLQNIATTEGIKNFYGIGQIIEVNIQTKPDLVQKNHLLISIKIHLSVEIGYGIYEEFITKIFIDPLHIFESVLFEYVKSFSKYLNKIKQEHVVMLRKIRIANEFYDDGIEEIVNYIEENNIDYFEEADLIEIEDVMDYNEIDCFSDLISFYELQQKNTFDEIEQITQLENKLRGLDNINLCSLKDLELLVDELSQILINEKIDINIRNGFSVFECKPFLYVASMTHQ